MLFDGVGNEYNEEAQIGELMVYYFDDLFNSMGAMDMDEVIENDESKCTEEMKFALLAPYSHEEIPASIKQMHPT